MCCGTGEGVEKWHHRPRQLEELQTETPPPFPVGLKTSAQHHTKAHKYSFLNFLSPPAAPPGKAGAAPGCQEEVLSAHVPDKMQAWL